MNLEAAASSLQSKLNFLKTPANGHFRFGFRRLATANVAALLNEHLQVDARVVRQRRILRTEIKAIRNEMHGAKVVGAKRSATVENQELIRRGNEGASVNAAARTIASIGTSTGN